MWAHNTIVSVVSRLRLVLKGVDVWFVPHRVMSHAISLPRSARLTLSLCLLRYWTAPPRVEFCSLDHFLEKSPMVDAAS